MTKQLVRDISASQGIIKDSIGKKPLLYRPPVGLTNPHTFSAIKKLGMTCIGWNMRAGDAGNRRLSGIKKISSLAKPGAVVMVHDCLPVPQYKADILEQVEKICISIREQKLSAIHIGEMFTVPVYE
jgi:peptidoglycan/xylan/chitin deacetylase (PgdA/CDA1 family)